MNTAPSIYFFRKAKALAEFFASVSFFGQTEERRRIYDSADSPSSIRQDKGILDHISLCRRRADSDIRNRIRRLLSYLQRHFAGDGKSDSRCNFRCGYRFLGREIFTLRPSIETKSVRNRLGLYMEEFPGGEAPRCAFQKRRKKALR